MRQLNDLKKLDGCSVLVRIDTDVDVIAGRIVDDYRLRAALSTIRHLLGKGAEVTLIGHRGRPEGKVNPTLALKPIAKRLCHLLVPQAEVKLIKPVTDRSTDSPVWQTQYQLGHKVRLLENLRFDPGEEANEPEFVQLLAAGQTAFVNESFATAHRTAASTVGISEKLPSYAGLRLVDELAHLNLVKDSPAHPFILIVGGAKVPEKLGLLEHFLPKVDYVLTGGVVANMLLAATGVDVKKSKVDRAYLDLAKQLIKHRYDPATGQGKIVIPLDSLWNNDQILDIGSDTVKLYAKLLLGSKTVFWAGDMGYAEDKRFAAGTQHLAELLALRHQGLRMVGGGDTAAALKQLQLVDKIDFVSTGGGAALEYLSGKPLPGLKVLG